MKKKIIILNIILLIILPINILAYSNKIIIGGETIGIKVKSNGIYVVGFYEVNNKLIAKNQGFKVGDIIKSIDNIDVNNIDDLSNIIKEDKQYKFKIIRNNKEEELSLKLEEENNTYKVDDEMQNGNNERFRDFINELIDAVNELKRGN